MRPGEGTSFAVPLVSGALALLGESGHHSFHYENDQLILTTARKGGLSGHVIVKAQKMKEELLSKALPDGVRNAGQYKNTTAWLLQVHKA